LRNRTRLGQGFFAKASPGFQAEIAARTLALPDAQSVEDLAALLTSAGEH
jgi:hypothetical protein